MKKFWVITEAYNEYDQYGDYLVAVFHKKPSLEDLKKLKAYTKGKLDEIDAETAILKGNAAHAAQNLSAVDLIENDGREWYVE